MSSLIIYESMLRDCMQAWQLKVQGSNLPLLPVEGSRLLVDIEVKFSWTKRVNFLVTHPIDRAVKRYDVDPLNYSLWFNKRELCRTSTTTSATTTHRAADTVTAILVV